MKDVIDTCVIVGALQDRAPFGEAALQFKHKQRRVAYEQKYTKVS